MKYIPLKHKIINLGPSEQIEIDADQGLILIPNDNSKIYIHWKNAEGKLVSTYTMTFPTKVEGKVLLINGLKTSTQVKTIW